MKTSARPSLQQNCTRRRRRDETKKVARRARISVIPLAISKKAAATATTSLSLECLRAAERKPFKLLTAKAVMLDHRIVDGHDALAFECADDHRNGLASNSSRDEALRNFCFRKRGLGQRPLALDLGDVKRDAACAITLQLWTRPQRPDRGPRHPGTLSLSSSAETPAWCCSHSELPVVGQASEKGILARRRSRCGQRLKAPFRYVSAILLLV